MIDLSRRAVLGGIALLPVAGCVSTSADPVVEPIDYGMRLDGGFSIPALQTDDVPAGQLRQVVPFEIDYPRDSIVIIADEHALYLVLRGGFALRYSIAVGREALGWRGNAEIYRGEPWPGAMAAPQPPLMVVPGGATPSVDVPAGPVAPMGARALYLRSRGTGADEGLRIHGTPIGTTGERGDTAGYYRMINQEIIDLYDRVGEGTLVTIL